LIDGTLDFGFEKVFAFAAFAAYVYVLSEVHGVGLLHDSPEEQYFFPGKFSTLVVVRFFSLLDSRGLSLDVTLSLGAPIGI